MPVEIPIASPRPTTLARASLRNPGKRRGRASPVRRGVVEQQREQFPAEQTQGRQRRLGIEVAEVGELATLSIRAADEVERSSRTPAPKRKAADPATPCSSSSSTSGPARIATMDRTHGTNQNIPTGYGNFFELDGEDGMGFSNLLTGQGVPPAIKKCTLTYSEFRQDFGLILEQAKSIVLLQSKSFSKSAWLLCACERLLVGEYMPSDTGKTSVPYIGNMDTDFWLV